MPSLTWGDLTTEVHGGQVVAVRLPWEGTERAVKLTRRGYLAGYRTPTDPDTGEPTGPREEVWAHYVEVPGIGPELSLVASTPVRIPAAAAKVPTKRPPR